MLCCCSGTGPPPPTCKAITFTVFGCTTSPINGATVALTNGGNTYSGVTSSVSGTPGRVIVTVANVGVWTYTVTPPAGSNWTGATGSINVTACGTFPILSQNVFLGNASGYTCTNESCCPQPGPPYQTVIWPSSVTVSDGFGAVTCASTGGGSYVGCAMRRAAIAFDCSINSTVANVDVPTFFLVTCSGAITVAFNSCKPAGGSCFGQAAPYYPCVGTCTLDPTCGYQKFSGLPGSASVPGGNTAACPSIAYSGTTPTLSSNPSDISCSAYQIYGAHATLSVSS